MKIIDTVIKTCSKCGKKCWFEYYECKGKVYCYSCFNKIEKKITVKHK